MHHNEKDFNRFGLSVPEIWLPEEGVDQQRWSVVACDQYTSEPEYWQRVEKRVGDAPSTLRLIYPECYLNEANPQERIEKIQKTMHQYLQEQVLRSCGDGFILVKRQTADGKSRWGLMAAVDLEQYNYHKDSTSLIRATEGTILERLPPRIRIREGAPLELPHIMILLNDPERLIIEPLKERCGDFSVLYDTELMENGGRLTGYKVDGQAAMDDLLKGLRRGADPAQFRKEYGTADVLLYAMGDGNHSLATAKAIWEKLKEERREDPRIMEHPARWALAELVNIYDEGIVFEPIHRVLFDIDEKQFLAEAEKAGFRLTHAETAAEMQKAVAAQSSGHTAGFAMRGEYGLLTMTNPEATIPAGTLQTFIDGYLAENRGEVDYIHGSDALFKLSEKEKTIGIFLPAVEKSAFFRTVIKDGAFPRKTFSMGEAEEKRFYMEARKIIP